MDWDRQLQIGKLLDLISLLVLLAIFSAKLAPYSMGEFCHYHSITSHHYRYNALNTYRENCRGYNLNLLNSRSDSCLSSLMLTREVSLPWSTIHLSTIWKSPISARLIGLIFLLIQSIVLSWIFNLRYPLMLTFLVSFFAYSFQHMVDTSPVFYTMTSIFWSSG